MNSDDPKFTAHALGEIEDLTPAECAEIEALLASDPAAAAEAAETRALAARLRAELPGETAVPLKETQRAAVLEAIGEEEVVDKVVRFPRRAKALMAIAACAVIGVSAFLTIQWNRVQQRERIFAGSGISDPRAVPNGSYWPFKPHDTFADGGRYADAAPAQNEELVRQSAELKPNASAAEPALKPQSETNESLTLRNDLLSNPGNKAETIAALTVPAAPASPAPEPSDPNHPAPATLAAIPPPPPVQMPMATPAPGVALKGYAAGGSAKAGFKTARAPMPTTKSRSTATVDLNGYAMSNLGGSIEREAGQFGARGLAGKDMPGNPSDPDDFNTTAFDAITENAFLTARENPLSTLSVDVDTASYAIVRRFLDSNHRPPKGAVRIEELLNYFTYDYPQPKGDAPFSATMEVAACPWAPEHRLVRVGLKGREIPRDERPPSNLVFLIDVSGSMNMPNKLPLLKQSFGLLVDQLREQDQVAIVVYAGNSGCVLQPTHDRRKMREALSRLEAGGSTNGASGIQLAYKLAEQSFIPGGTNRVILATDGDWNVGVTSQSDLLDMIAKKAKKGVFLTVLGFGMDNLKDSMLVKLADRGNGNYAYIDTLIEAKKVFVEQLSSTLVTIAKDVKIQVEFNPAKVGAYRLIGYEKRLLAKEDFNDDKKDAGEIGAGHTVTALYEVVPAGQETPQIAMVDKLKYQPQPGATPEKPRAQLGLERPEGKSETPIPATPAIQPAAPSPEPKHPAAVPAAVSNEMLTLKLRYKAPEGDTSKLLEFPLTDAGTGWEKSSRDFRFAAAVAGYGMLLRDSTYRGQTTWQAVSEWAHEGLGTDASGYRAEFLGLLEKAKAVTQ